MCTCVYPIQRVHEQVYEQLHDEVLEHKHEQDKILKFSQENYLEKIKIGHLCKFGKSPRNYQNL